MPIRYPGAEQHDEHHLKISDLYREVVDAFTAYIPSLVTFFRKPQTVVRSINYRSGEAVRRGLAFLGIGLGIAIVISYISIIMLPKDERSFYERQFNVGQIQLQVLLFLIIFAVLVHGCLRLLNGHASYAETFMTLVYMFAYIWPVLSAVSLLFSRIVSGLLATPVVLIPPIAMRALDPIERSLTNKFIAAGALTFLTFEALYLFYLYVSCLRTVHRLSALRSGAATLGAILVAQVVIPPIQRFSVLGCEWVKPLCEFLK